MLEAAVIIGHDSLPIYWHTPINRTGGSLPDSRDLWDVIWENRDKIMGIAHSHPGAGIPGPSNEDLTTFSAVELALGKRLTWWISSSNATIDLKWSGPEKYSYAKSVLPGNPLWFEKLLILSERKVGV